MRRTLVLAWAIIAAGAVAAAATGARAQEGLFGSRTRFTEPTGEAIYWGVCAGCHMPDGAGAEGAGRYPALAHDPRLAAPAYPIQLVLRGRGAMPPFERLLTDEQVAAVVGFIRQSFGNGFSPPPSARDVQALR